MLLLLVHIQNCIGIPCLAYKNNYFDKLTGVFKYPAIFPDAAIAKISEQYIQNGP